MPKPRRRAPADNKSSGREASGTNWLKRVGAITAVLSLVFGLHQLTQLMARTRERQRIINELRATAEVNRSRGDYAAAWSLLQQAVVAADEGGTFAKMTGRIDRQRAELRFAQEDVAMRWLENVKVKDGEAFSRIVDDLIPVLNRALASATGSRKADLLAHVGWGHFLKMRDGAGEVDPEALYREALVIDPRNPYANVYAGHWEIHKGRDFARAQSHFDLALSSQRARSHVRFIQLSALRNLRTTDRDKQMLQAVNDMRRAGETIDAQARSDIYNVYYFAVRDFSEVKELTRAVPPSEQIETLKALFFDASFDPSKQPVRDAAVATLLELAGRPQEALQSWRVLRASLDEDVYATVAARAEEAIDRLSPVL